MSKKCLLCGEMIEEDSPFVTLCDGCEDDVSQATFDAVTNLEASLEGLYDRESLSRLSKASTNANYSFAADLKHETVNKLIQHAIAGYLDLFDNVVPVVAECNNIDEEDDGSITIPDSINNDENHLDELELSDPNKDLTGICPVCGGSYDISENETRHFCDCLEYQDEEDDLDEIERDSNHEEEDDIDEPSDDNHAGSTRK